MLYYPWVDTTIEKRISEFKVILNEFQNTCVSQINRFAKELLEIFDGNHKVLICGNGGSAADAQHLAAEFVSSFGLGLKRKSLPVLSLSTDSSIMTAIANDFEFNLVFRRQVEGLGTLGDGLIVISTSGESSNCLLAAESAKKIGMKIFSLTRVGSTLENISDFSIAVPSQNTQYIQQCHVIAYHIIVELVENSIMKRAQS